MTNTEATLGGTIFIEPNITDDEVNLAPQTLYVRLIATDDGSGIIAGDWPPLSTESVAREVRALIEALPGFVFNGFLVRTAASKYGSARSRIVVRDSVVRF